MFSVSLTIEDLDVQTPAEAAEAFRQAILHDYPLVVVVADDDGHETVMPTFGIEQQMD